MKDDVIRGILFSALDAEHRAALLAHCTPRSYARGDTIFARGEPGSLIYIIETGRVEVSVTSRRGRRTILNQMGPGEVLGELAMIDGGTRSADAVAATDTTGRVLTRQHFLMCLEDNPAMAIAIVQDVGSKLRALTELHANQIAMDGGARLATVLLRLFDKWGEALPTGELRLEQEISQSDLGDFAGLARENVNRYMRGWRAKGFLRLDGGRLVLSDRGAFEDLAED